MRSIALALALVAVALVAAPVAEASHCEEGDVVCETAHEVNDQIERLFQPCACDPEPEPW